jgi:circadian clock protein KaiC
VEIDALPEFAVADGIIHLVNQKHGVRDERYLRVLKLRGSGYRLGEHAFRLSQRGFSVYPRLVTSAQAEHYSLVDERLSTGVAELDTAVGGGLRRGSSTVLVGPTGSGKTILSLQFLFEGAARGESGLLVSFQENPTMLRRNIGSLGWDAAALDAGGLLTHLYVSPVEMNLDDVMEQIVDVVEAKGIRRLVIDSLDDLQATAPDVERYRSYVYAMMQTFGAASITTFVTLESTVGAIGEPVNPSHVSYLADNVIALHYAETENEIRRSLCVIKTRGSDHDARVRELQIGPRGVTVGAGLSLSERPVGRRPSEDRGDEDGR